MPQPLPRVAHLSTGLAPGPPTTKPWDPAHAAASTRTMRGDPAKDQMHSLIFPDQPNKDPNTLGARTQAAQVASYGTSTNHPLSVAGVAAGDRAPDVASRLRASGDMSRLQPQLLPHHAGRPAPRGVDVRSIITGSDDAPPFVPGKRTAPRTQYEHPTYQIRRDYQGSAAKDALYGGQPAQQRRQQPFEGDEDPGLAYLRRLKHAYDQLAAAMPSVPRDADGNTSERALMQLLAEQGLEFSLDGFAELLARCDLSPDGFPDFRDFVGCAQRPHRQPPPGGGEPQPPPATEPPAVAPPPQEAPPVAEAAPEPQQFSEAAPSAAAAMGVEAGQTWGQLKVQNDVMQQQQQTTVKPIYNSMYKGAMPLGPPRVTPLGANLKQQYERSAARNMKFSKGFNPDHFL